MVLVGLSVACRRASCPYQPFARFGKPDDDRQLAAALGNLAGCYTKLQRPADAVRLRREALDLARAKLGPDDSDTLLHESSLINAYCDAGQFADALPIIERIVAAWEGIIAAGAFPPDQRIDLLYNAACHRATAARVLTRLAHPAEATIEAGRAVEWLRQAVGADFRDVNLLETDPDLEPLRGRADFVQIVAALKAKIAGK